MGKSASKLKQRRSQSTCKSSVYFNDFTEILTAVPPNEIQNKSQLMHFN